MMIQDDKEILLRKRFNRYFYQGFLVEYNCFSETIQGIAAENEQQRYTTLMLRRLMVLYFLQGKGLFDNDISYLANSLKSMQDRQGKDRFYRFYLLPLFHEGNRVGASPCVRPPAKEQGSSGNGRTQGDAPTLFPWKDGEPDIPALALPLFQVHPIEQNTPHIQIADDAFARLFAFFDRYQWKLEERKQEIAQNELYPEILGGIFEQQINQKQMGAYYTKDDVTTYIAKSTILPYLLHTVEAQYPEEFVAGSALWQLLRDRPERYISEAVQSERYLPKETKREYEGRRAYYHWLFRQLKMGQIHSIDDLITYNLDIVCFVQDSIAHCEKPALLLAFYRGIEQVSILDPTCGSGAFLLAAANILEPLYTNCLDRIQNMEVHRSFSNTTLDAYFNERCLESYLSILKKVEEYPTRRHFILSTILSNNLYGVDIMEEATELCKLRLFLALVGCSEKVEDVQTFSSVNWNIVTGNALVGSIHSGGRGRIGIHGDESPDAINRVPRMMEDQLQTKGEFYWGEAFPHVMKRGGFDVIVGNPPYIEYSKVRQEYEVAGYETQSYGNIYAAVVERSLLLCRPGESYLGLIVPLSVCGGERFEQLRRTMTSLLAQLWLANFEIFPGRLFDGAFQRLSIVIGQRGLINGGLINGAPTPVAREPLMVGGAIYTTRIQRWYAVERPYLIDLMRYVQAQQTVKADVFPKLASPLQEIMLQKLVEKAQGQSIASVLYPHKTEHFVYYQEATNYWMKATCGVPYYKKNGVAMEPAHGRFLYFRERRMARVVMAVMNSSLFYVWFATFADGFHLAHRLVKEFPLGKELYRSEELEQLAIRLEEDIRRHARVSTRNTKGHAIELEEYRMNASKRLLDEIDGVLARYYGLSEGEVEFVVGYDVKYRMGKEE